jgi:predicted SnoaL-like aldol condensation-catalyzing enzyme
MLRIAGAAAALSLLASAALAADAAQIEANKQAVLAFHAALTDTKDFATARKYLAPNYKQHNPTLKDGAEGIKALIDFFREKLPDARSEIKHVWTDGDYVILHVRFIAHPDTPGRAIADIYRMEDGKIAEHWDVIQDVPATSANPNGMF